MGMAPVARLEQTAPHPSYYLSALPTNAALSDVQLAQMPPRLQTLGAVTQIVQNPEESRYRCHVCLCLSPIIPSVP